jgi:hypothetical protein
MVVIGLTVLGVHCIQLRITGLLFGIIAIKENTQEELSYCEITAFVK